MLFVYLFCERNRGFVVKRGGLSQTAFRFVLVLLFFFLFRARTG